MVTKVRPPNKTLWALDEAIAHDADIAELVAQLLTQLEREEEAARDRFDKTARLRLATAVATLARLQLHCARLAALHRQARSNEYDRHERS